MQSRYCDISCTMNLSIKRHFNNFKHGIKVSGWWMMKTFSFHKTYYENIQILCWCCWYICDTSSLIVMIELLLLKIIEWNNWPNLMKLSESSFTYFFHSYLVDISSIYIYQITVHRNFYTIAVIHEINTPLILNFNIFR